MEKLVFDVVIIGSGFGGGPLAYLLSEAGLRILIIEKGNRLANNSLDSLKQINNNPDWYINGKKIKFPVSGSCVGGLSKIFGGHLCRLREKDFELLSHENGISPAWPISYSELEKYYGMAEEFLHVQGDQADDPTGPYRSSPFPFPPHQPSHEMLVFIDKLRQQNISVFPQPLSFNYSKNSPSSCDGCLARCCISGCKRDIESAFIAPALSRNQNTFLWMNSKVIELVTNRDGCKIECVKVEKEGKVHHVYGKYFVVACGAILSAALLLQSRNKHHPQGLGNSSGLLGCNYMQHFTTYLVGISRKKLNFGCYQKCFSINDFYFGDADYPFPMGNIQATGTISPYTFKESFLNTKNLFKFIPSGFLNGFLNHTFLLSVMSEDLPKRNNKMEVGQNQTIHFTCEESYSEGHNRLVAKAKKILLKAGFDLVVPFRNHIGNSAHGCGTLKFGENPSNSVLNPFCRSHDVENLYVVDAGFFPSSAAVNPALTIAAQSLRVGTHLREQFLTV